MPIFQIRALPQKSTIDRKHVLKTLCCESAKIFGLEPQHVWGTWEEIKDGLYVEGDKDAQTQPKGSHPPLVNLIAFEGRPQEMIEKALVHAANFLCQALEIDEGNIFITYTDALSGKVHTGGEVRRKL